MGGRLLLTARMQDHEPSKTRWSLDLGATCLGSSRVRFRVWAPRAKAVSVRIWNRDRAVTPLAPSDNGYFEGILDGLGAGARYRYVLDNPDTVIERPDPASRFQPEGVHGPSEVVDPSDFSWSDDRWRGRPLDRMIIYELHVGTFTHEGTFEAVIPHLDDLRTDLGVTAVELMPVAQFPGGRNWGYDGVYPFAPQAGYGGPTGLKRLIDACHAKDLAVILDVVYNHLGPEGNYLADYGPYFTDHYRTPWGAAVNYDGPDSDDVRHYVISNARYWITEYHVDGLRLDAIHGIFDFSARHIVADLADAVHAASQRLARIGLVIAESDLNDARVIAPVAEGGYGVDGQWNDDFHHALHTVLTDERAGYYQDFGRIEHLAAAIRDGFVYTGQRSSFRRRRHGNSSRNRAPSQFVVAAQTHDQIGNRARGDRLSTLVPFDALKVAAAALLLGPNVPLLFMGEEYAETAPFQYFVDHGDPALIEMVRTGRTAEFASFGKSEAFPDPQDPETFARSRLVRGRRRTPRQSQMLAWYRALITLRTSSPAFASTTHRVRWWESERMLAVHRPAEGDPSALVVLGFSSTPAAVILREPPGVWRRRLDAADAAFGGKGALHDLDIVHVTSEGVLIHVPAYSALAFLRDPLTP